MSWQDPDARTPPKRDFLLAWFAQEQRCFLTGGSALGLFYLDRRRSYDLDLFTSGEVQGKEVQNSVQRTAAAIGADCAALRTAPDFHRLRLTRGQDREVIDVVVDRVPQLDAQKTDFGRIRADTLREITANKLTTLLSRTALKDVVALYFLEQAGRELLAAIPDAQAKDGGWEPAVVAMLLSGLQVREMPAWMIKDLAPAELESFLHRLHLAFAKLALPEP